MTYPWQDALTPPDEPELQHADAETIEARLRHLMHRLSLTPDRGYVTKRLRAPLLDEWHSLYDEWLFTLGLERYPD